MIYNDAKTNMNFAEELRFLRLKSFLSPLSNLKLVSMRKKGKDPIEIMEFEYAARFKFWEKLCEKDWHDSKREDRINLEDFTHESIVRNMAYYQELEESKKNNMKR
jgi:hypothetical protein